METERERRLARIRILDTALAWSPIRPVEFDLLDHLRAAE
jgi:hypothetical protein